MPGKSYNGGFTIPFHIYHQNTLDYPLTRPFVYSLCWKGCQSCFGKVKCKEGGCCFRVGGSSGLGEAGLERLGHLFHKEI